MSRNCKNGRKDGTSWLTTAPISYCASGKFVTNCHLERPLFQKWGVKLAKVQLPFVQNVDFTIQYGVNFGQIFLDLF